MCPRRATRSGSTIRAATWPPSPHSPFQPLGAKGLGVSDDYATEKMPAVNVGLLDGELAWRQHDGGHTDAPNWKYFLSWADFHFKRRYTPAPACDSADARSASVAAPPQTDAARRPADAAHRLRTPCSRTGSCSAKRTQGTIDVYFDRQLDHSPMGRDRLSRTS